MFLFHKTALTGLGKIPDLTQKFPPRGLVFLVPEGALQAIGKKAINAQL